MSLFQPVLSGRRSSRSAGLSRILPLSLAIAAVLPGAAFAANADAGDELDEVVVTATRTAATADATLAPVEVISRDEILRAQASSLADLLRGRAGINITNQGGEGKLTTMFVRGSESDHVLVLIDGVRVGSATSGLVSFQDLPVSLIDRIEIVRGPRSSLYGSEAIGGVIQIFTRRDRGDATFRFHAGAGSHGRREGGIGIGGGSEKGWFGIDAGFKRTDGINACTGAGDPIFAGCFTTEPDRDGYTQQAFALRGGVNIGESVVLQGHGLRVSGENEYDGSFVNQSDIVQQVVGAQLKWQAGERVAVQFAAGSNKDESENFLDGAPAGDFTTQRDSASVQSDITLAERQTLTLGVDWLRDRVDSSTQYRNTNTDRIVRERGNRAAFVQYQGGFETSSFGAHDLQLAVRRDDNDQFGGKTTGNIAWGVGFADHWRITASYGTAFKAPTFNELYFPFFGNPNLRPESSKTFDLGVAWRGEHTRIELNAFETSVDDLIAYDGSIFLPNNIEKTRLRGAELRVETALLGWNIAGAASWLDPENRAPGFNEGNDLPRRARETVRIDADRTFGDFSVGLTGIAEGERYDDLANTRSVDGFATLDLRAEYRFARHWTLQAKVANLFDERYETTSFYNQPGRTWSLMLRFQPAE